MTSSGMKTGLGEIIILYFNVPAVNHRLLTQERLAGGPKGVQILLQLRIVAVHQLVGAGELFRSARSQGNTPWQTQVLVLGVSRSFRIFLWIWFLISGIKRPSV